MMANEWEKQEGAENDDQLILVQPKKIISPGSENSDPKPEWWVTQSSHPMYINPDPWSEESHKTLTKLLSL